MTGVGSAVASSLGRVSRVFLQEGGSTCTRSFLAKQASRRLRSGLPTATTRSLPEGSCDHGCYCRSGFSEASSSAIRAAGIVNGGLTRQKCTTTNYRPRERVNTEDKGLGHLHPGSVPLS